MTTLATKALTPLRRLRAASHSCLEDVVRSAASRSLTRAGMNALYRRLSFERQSAIHARFSRIFYQRGAATPGEWHLTFNGRSIRVPLRSAHIGLDWDAAMSVLGHDADVKTTYAALLNSPAPPQVFVDIGTNYGTHSILFLVSGIGTISFEPNPTCHDFFRQLCGANAVVPCIESVALGDEEGSVELRYPASDPWLGTTVATVSGTLADMRRLESHTVVQRRLDDYLPRFEGRRVLIKIDTEGAEVKVLRGARETLEHVRPIVLFESWPAPKDERRALFDTLQEARYAIHALPWLPQVASEPLSSQMFLQHSGVNFIGLRQQ